MKLEIRYLLNLSRIVSNKIRNIMQKLILVLKVVLYKDNQVFMIPYKTSTQLIYQMNLEMVLILKQEMSKFNYRHYQMKTLTPRIMLLM